MSAKFEVENPSKVKFTLTATLSLSEWVEIKKQLSDGEAKPWLWPASYLVDAIRDMASQAEKTFYPTSKPDSCAAARTSEQSTLGERTQRNPNQNFGQPRKDRQPYDVP